MLRDKALATLLPEYSPSCPGLGYRGGVRMVLAVAALLIGCGRVGFSPLQPDETGSNDAGAGGSSGDSGVLGTGLSGTTEVYLKASNTRANATFGNAIAISQDGNTLAIASVGESSGATGIDGDQADTSASLSGAVYVFVRSGTAWTQQAYLKASNAESGDGFGGALALSGDGNLLVVGATAEASIATGIDGNQADNSASSAGAAYAFVRNGTTWTQQAYIKASNTMNDLAFFGSSVAVSADASTVAIGAWGESSSATGINHNQNNTFAAGAGAVYVFSVSAGTWTQQAYVKASNTETIDLFGSAVALAADGNTLVATAPGESSAATGIGGNQADNSAADAGAAYVFSRNGTTWSQQAYVKASNTAANAYLGTCAILSADGNTLAIGAEDEASAASNAGAVYMFSRSGTTWAQQAYLQASNPAASAYFGNAASLSGTGDTLVVGAWYEASDAIGVGGNQADSSDVKAGAAYVFTRGATSWSQAMYVKASNTDPGDLFGSAVAMSADASTLVIGASAEASSATGIAGDQTDNSAASSGAAYVLQ
jgi:hypothetical protein